MNDENSNGAHSGRTAPITEDELRREDTRIIARLHRDAAELYALLQGRNEAISRLVEEFGSRDCRRAREALQRLTRYSHRLLEREPQFADLKGTP